LPESPASVVEGPDFLSRFRERDPAVIQTLAGLYLRQIFRAARGAGLDTARAEDVVQATFATLIETAPRFEGRSHIRTWLFGILYRKISEVRRDVEKDRRADDIDEVMESRFKPDGTWLHPPQPVETAFEAVEIREAIAGCLEDVPTSQRMVFILREVEEFSTKEICKILDVSRTNFGVLIYRARNRLRECLEAKGMKR
jgi:RNA polymerase sigma-70 factor (ECF subfamily)